MNERIRELSEQAQLYARQGMAKTVIELKRYDADVASERYAKDFEQKFAELIVWECAEQSMSIGRYNTPSGVTPDLSIAIAVGLKKHFGVTE